MTELKSPRLNYLLNLHGVYAVHVNTMFNYFSVAAALLVTAYAQSLDPAWKLPGAVPFALSSMGLALSIIFLGIHNRSRSLLSTIESALEREENTMFDAGQGFFNHKQKDVKGRPIYDYQFPLKILFPSAYLVFVLAFFLMLIFALMRP